MKRVLSIILSITMLLSITAGIDLSAYAATSGDFKYQILEDGTAEFTDYYGSATDLSIPSNLDGYVVTSIGEGAFYGCDSLTSVTIPNSVTSIGADAFYDCDSLTSVTMPDSVTSIGYYVFSDCDSLISITIPNSVTNIGFNAFAGCNSLTSIDVDSQNQYYASQNGVLFNKNKTELIQYPAGNTRTVYTILDNVTSIGDDAFAYCDRLTNVTIPNSVTNIGFNAFADCDSLTSVTIPDSVISIGNYAFYHCDSLTSIDVDSQNQYYASQNGVLFNKDKTELIQYPVGNTRTAYTIPNSVTSIGENTFRSCSNLTSVTIPNSVTSIGDSVFSDCFSLTSVTIPDSVTSIGYYVFSDCDSLISITIPNSVTNIGFNAFAGCNSLTSIDVDSQNQYYASQNGVLFNKDKTELIQYPVGNTRTAYTIPDSVTSIGDEAFSYCDGLTSVTIPDSVTSIGYYAFSDCLSLIDVYYNSTIADWNNISIGDYNENLTNATIHCSDGIINEKPHTHSFASETTPATCTQQGYTTYTCECGETKTETIPATGHIAVTDKAVPSTCTKAGLTEGSHCSVCGMVINPQKTVAKKAHTYKSYTTKATISKNGSAVTKCTVCGAVKSKSTIYYPKTIKLSKTSYTYNGKTQTPSVTVKNSKGRTLKKNADYTVTYAKGRKNVGKYAVKITFKGKYSGSKTLYYTIKPKSTSISKLTAGKKKFTVKWKKQASQTTGYQVQYSTNKNFKSAKTVTVSKNKTTSKSITKLKAKKKYYVRIRTYKTVGKTKYYSSWSKAKAVTTKK